MIIPSANPLGSEVNDSISKPYEGVDILYLQLAKVKPLLYPKGQYKRVLAQNGLAVGKLETLFCRSGVQHWLYC